MKYNLLLKSAVIVVITLLLLIPTFMIQNLITERQQTQQNAVMEVSSKWGNAQTLSGPFLTIPFIHYQKEISENDKKEKLIPIKQSLHILPENLSIKGDVSPQKRSRGIYEVVLYNSEVKISGDFQNIDWEKLGIDTKNLLMDQAYITVGVSDLRGIENRVQLKWNNRDLLFNPGTVTGDLAESGISIGVPVSVSDKKPYTFSFQLNLKGSQWLRFVPIGKVTDVELKSPWANPGFDGAFLPDSRTVTPDGFTAHWNILNLNRNFPQQWVGDRYSLKRTSFGVDLLLPVDNYQKAMRSIKYAILFIALTFLVFFFVEIMNKKFIHPIQYALVGIALVLFFSLLLSFSEYMSFNLSYIVSALLTLALVAGYARAILRSGPLTFLVTGILTALYGFIFVIIQLQDYALLFGSVGLFVILAIVMYFSRKIDWYSISGELSKADKQGE
ncbi:MAG: cell envelope integrity protein CreD [Bacteroidales bacterium]|nr:cell envelope integrity protein CreD [Bacteroidales bacterium]